MSIASLPADLKAFEDAWSSLQVEPILRTSGAVFIDAADVAAIFMNPGFKATAEDAACKAECKVILDRLEVKAKEPVPMQADVVGKLFPGDGSFLKLILEAVLKLAPLFI